MYMGFAGPAAPPLHLTVGNIALLLESSEVLIDGGATDSEVIGELIHGHAFLAIEKQGQDLSLRLTTDRAQAAFQVLNPNCS
jgi:hypothetical protein